MQHMECPLWAKSGHSKTAISLKVEEGRYQKAAFLNKLRKFRFILHELEDEATR